MKFRYCEYKSRVTGEIKINSHRRCDWKISNTNLEFLNKLQGIIKDKLNIDILITSTQKALGLPPGMSMCTFSKKAVAKAEKVEFRGTYLDLLAMYKYLKKKN